MGVGDVQAVAVLGGMDVTFAHARLGRILSPWHEAIEVNHVVISGGVDGER